MSDKLDGTTHWEGCEKIHPECAEIVGERRGWQRVMARVLDRYNDPPEGGWRGLFEDALLDMKPDHGESLARALHNAKVDGCRDEFKHWCKHLAVEYKCGDPDCPIPLALAERDELIRAKCAIVARQMLLDRAKTEEGIAFANDVVSGIDVEWANVLADIEGTAAGHGLVDENNRWRDAPSTPTTSRCRKESNKSKRRSSRQNRLQPA